MNKFLDEKRISKLRKAYFSGKLDAFLSDCLSEGIEPVEYEAVMAQLEEFKRNGEAIKQKFEKFSNTDEFKPPSVEDLMGISDEKKEAVKKWEEEREADYNTAKDLIRKARKANKTGRVSADEWLSWALELAILQFSLDQYRVWKDQLYRGRLTQIMDVYGVSRAEAEERAKLTPQYRAYKEAVLFREMTEETVKLLKKWAGLYN